MISSLNGDAAWQIIYIFYGEDAWQMIYIFMEKILADDFNF